MVPILVVLPLYESAASGGSLPLAAAAAAGGGSVLAALLPGAAKALLGLGALLVGGRVVLRRAFEVVAGARSTEAFVALCLLTGARAPRGWGAPAEPSSSSARALFCALFWGGEGACHISLAHCLRARLQ